ncbi:MAG: Na+/H+ antiporter NhaA [Helicobacter sp.]|nr:Na+/H+ antiporter NhaA [Helicobacter sp.]
MNHKDKQDRNATNAINAHNKNDRNDKSDRNDRNWKQIAAIFDSELLGGFILIIATALAIIIANTNFSHMYFELWHTQIGLRIHDLFIGFDLHHWINDVLMAFFFLMVGLEIKREFLVGDLNDVKKAAFPIIGALGGMVVPALIYIILNYNTPSMHGFGVPMATDIAFAMGVILLLGRRIPVALKVFLVTLAVVDDLGAIVVIAIFYTTGSLDFYYLIAGIIVFGILILLNYFGVKKLTPYMIVGIALWFCVYKVGVHPTISAVLLAFTIPLGVKDKTNLRKIAASPLRILEGKLHGLSVYFIMPIFAFANAGVHIGSDVNFGIDHIFLGIFLGLLVGKPVGIFAITYIFDKLKIAKKPEGVSFMQIFGAGLLAGIGFTMSIFVSGLSFANQESAEVAKISILSSSMLAAILGSIFLTLCSKNLKSK